MNSPNNVTNYVSGLQLTSWKGRNSTTDHGYSIFIKFVKSWTKNSKKWREDRTALDPIILLYNHVTSDISELWGDPLLVQWRSRKAQEGLKVPIIPFINGSHQLGVYMPRFHQVASFPGFFTRQNYPCSFHIFPYWCRAKCGTNMHKSDRIIFSLYHLVSVAQMLACKRHPYFWGPFQDGGIVHLIRYILFLLNVTMHTQW